jgi:hypothetical protein
VQKKEDEIVGQGERREPYLPKNHYHAPKAEKATSAPLPVAPTYNFSPPSAMNMDTGQFPSLPPSNNSKKRRRGKVALLPSS